MIKYPPRIKMANIPTPLEKLEILSRELDVELYAKRDDMTGVELSGNKVRKLEFLLSEAMEEGADTVVTAGGVQSNHCRATAAACARLGLRCHLILRTEPPSPPFEGNLFLNHLLGAEFTYIPLPEFKKSEQLDFSDVMEKLRSEGKKPFFFPIGGSVPTGCWGYVLAFEELMQQLDREGIENPHIVLAVGSGGTQTGLVLGRRLLERSEVKITGFNVCDSVEFFQKHNAEILKQTVEKFQLDIRPEEESFQLVGDYIGPGYAQSYPELIDTIKMVALKQGLALDPVYTGKAFHGLLSEIKKGTFPKDRPIIFLHTGGLFGLFPQKELF